MKSAKAIENVLCYILYYCIYTVAGSTFFEISFIRNDWFLHGTADELFGITVNSDTLFILQVLFASLLAFSAVYLCVHIIIRLAKFRIKGNVLIFSTGYVVFALSALLYGAMRAMEILGSMD